MFMFDPIGFILPLPWPVSAFGTFVQLLSDSWPDFRSARVWIASELCPVSVRSLSEACPTFLRRIAAGFFSDAFRMRLGFLSKICLTKLSSEA
jgi:hypothetical protein